ncbi:MAG: 50S ribosomal protein L1 [Planctomycetes bacterium]|nr:50S ribosomal protein L1 [Planctomycetota bacterium]MCW8136500.1 50S ribosomal protein L1 [Planctomycetota bacterium]
MAKKFRSKKYKQAAKSVEVGRRYSPAEAVAVLAKFPKVKFDETVNLAVKLNVDPRKADQNLRGALSLPHGVGKSQRVIAFVEGDAAEQALAAGAVAVGGAELAKRVEEGWLDFDKAIAHPSQMRHVGRLGKVLGPKGLMPTPKAGTVTEDVVAAVKEFAAGKLEFRTDAGGNIHMPLGKRSFSNDKLLDNLNHVLEHIKGLRPAAVKGAYISKVSLSGTMTPGVHVAVEQ